MIVYHGSIIELPLPDVLHSQKYLDFGKGFYTTTYCEQAMDVYYRSDLAVQIQDGKYGIDNVDYKYLAEDLIENEPSLFQ